MFVGPVELASAGVSISIFNIVSKLFNIPLLSVATSFVAEDISKNASPVSSLGEVNLMCKALLFRISDSHQCSKLSSVILWCCHAEEGHEVVTNGKPLDGVTKREQLSSVSTALLLAVGIGLFEAIALSLGSGVFLNLMGISSVSLSHTEVIQDNNWLFSLPSACNLFIHLCLDVCICFSATCTLACVSIDKLMPTTWGWVARDYIMECGCYHIIMMNS